MKLVTPPLIIKEDDAFSNDLFERENYGRALLNIVSSYSDALVVSLDGNWGEGKTTFVKMWQGLLSESKIPNIYIDAFANDHVDDPFISVASAIMHYADTHITKEHKTELPKLKEKLKKIGVPLLSWSARTAIKLGSFGFISDSDINTLKEIKKILLKGEADAAGDLIEEKISAYSKDSDINTLKEIKKILLKGEADAVGDLIEEKINAYSKDIELVKSFKELLSELPSKLQEESDQPLVIIIDELDRCKPTFAVELVEKIKHLFSVKNIVFLLVMNKTQLEESIRSVYGSKIDAHTYLQKFVNVETQLPKRTDERYPNDLSEYVSRLFELHELETSENDKYIIDYLDPLANHLKLSLRQLEKVFTNLVIFYGIRTENAFKSIPIMVFLAVVKVADPKLFDNLLHQRSSYPEVTERLNLLNLDKESERYKKLDRLIIKWVRCALLSPEEVKNLSDKEKGEIGYFDFHNTLLGTGIDEEELIPMFAKQLSMFEVP